MSSCSLEEGKYALTCMFFCLWFDAHIVTHRAVLMKKIKISVSTYMNFLFLNFLTRLLFVLWKVRPYA